MHQSENIFSFNHPCSDSLVPISFINSHFFLLFIVYMCTELSTCLQYILSTVSLTLGYTVWSELLFNNNLSSVSSAFYISISSSFPFVLVSIEFAKHLIRTSFDLITVSKFGSDCFVCKKSVFAQFNSKSASKDLSAANFVWVNIADNTSTGTFRNSGWFTKDVNFFAAYFVIVSVA